MTETSIVVKGSHYNDALSPVEDTTTGALSLSQSEYLIHEFLTSLDVSAKTREALKQYLSFLDQEGVKLNETSRNTVIAYKQELELSKKATTINAYLTAVRSFYTYLESVKYYPNVARGIKSEKVNRNSPKQALTIEQAKELVNAKKPKSDDVTALRDRAIVNLMLSRGLRTIEITRANVEDIQVIAGNSVLFIQGKGYKDKSQFVVVMKPIRDYLKARGDCKGTDPLFISTSNRNHGNRLTTRSVSRIVANELEKHGYKSESVTAHSLRHTAVTLSLLGGATPQEVQQLARHSNIETTFIYAHNIDRMQAKAETSIDNLLYA